LRRCVVGNIVRMKLLTVHHVRPCFRKWRKRTKRTKSHECQQNLGNTSENPKIGMFLFLSFCSYQYACAYSIGFRYESLNQAYFAYFIAVID